MWNVARSCAFPIYLILVLGYMQHVNGGNSTDAENILDHVLKGNSKTIRPSYDQPIYVSVRVALFSINDFDEISGTFSTVAGFILYWTDPRVKWTKDEFGNISVIEVPISRIWYPDLYFINPAKKMKAIGEDTFFIRLHNTGVVERYIGSITSTTCSVDMTYFPFDQQVRNY